MIYAPYASIPPTDLQWTKDSGEKDIVAVLCDGSRAIIPTIYPTDQPTIEPTQQPSLQPTEPTLQPTRSPNLCEGDPRGLEILIESGRPPKNSDWYWERTDGSENMVCKISYECWDSHFPTNEPTEEPTEEPTKQPSQQPTIQPTMSPTQQPTIRFTNDYCRI